MPVDIAELTTELARPTYALMSNNEIRAHINDLAGTDAATIDVEFVSPALFQNAVEAAEYNSITSVARLIWSDLLRLDPIPIRMTGIRAQIMAIWGAGTTTRASLAALQTRTGSRAEVLWGDGATVTLDDIREAKGLT